MNDQPEPGLPSDRLRDAEGDEARDLIRLDRRRPDGRSRGIHEPLAEALHLDEVVPRGRARDRVVALRERGRGRGRPCGRARIVDIHVDELCAEGTPEGRRQVTCLEPEDDARAVVEHLEALDVERTGVEVVRSRIGVVPRAVVVACRIRDVEQHRSRREVEHDRPHHTGGAAAGLTATTLSTIVPPVIGSETVQVPLAPTVIEAVDVAEFASVFVAATKT